MSSEGRHAVVTGGGSGIGRGICLQLAAAGTAVTVVDVNEARAAQVAGEIAASSQRAIAVAADVANAPQVGAALERARALLGPIHIVVNCAGIGEFVPLLQMSQAQWDRMIAVHLTGTFHCTRGALPDMIAAGWGRIVNIASVAGLNGGGSGLAHYAAAKSGVIGFTKAIAHEFGPVGITANAIAPGLVDTPMLRGSGLPDEIVTRSVSQLPLRRIGQPEDIAAACAYLVSDAAGFITGQVISPNGGAYL